MSEKKTYVSREEFCRDFFPRTHAEKTCGCFPKPKRRVLVIQPRSGRTIRRA